MNSKFLTVSMTFNLCEKTKQPTLLIYSHLYNDIFKVGLTWTQVSGILTSAIFVLQLQLLTPFSQYTLTRYP